MERKSLFASILAASTAATPLAQAETVTWYQQHKPAMARELAWCRENPGYRNGECTNAEVARDRLTIKAAPPNQVANNGCSPVEAAIYRCRP